MGAGRGEGGRGGSRPSEVGSRVGRGAAGTSREALVLRFRAFDKVFLPVDPVIGREFFRGYLGDWLVTGLVGIGRGSRD
jgi:hypothetical protein